MTYGIRYLSVIRSLPVRFISGLARLPLINHMDNLNILVNVSLSRFVQSRLQQARMLIGYCTNILSDNNQAELCSCPVQ